MESFKLYTTVDITHTDKFRTTGLHESEWFQEQNFRTVFYTLGMRANIAYCFPPDCIEIKGRLIGFNTDHIIKVWRFDFFTEHNGYFGPISDPIKYLREDFTGIPFLSGLNESVEQNIDVFITEGKCKNIIFFPLNS